jgi:phosphate starvation-inducible PhoH-like protein
LNVEASTYTFDLQPADAGRLASLCGQFNEHIRQIEQHFRIKIRHRGHQFQLVGEKKLTKAAKYLLTHLYQEGTNNRQTLTPEQVHLALRSTPVDPLEVNKKTTHDGQTSMQQIKTQRGMVKAQGRQQQHYLNRILSHSISFGIGPAGTGKTYLAVACAVEALEKRQVDRIVLVRPAVEAGEKLGFLPGDLSEKINPYLRPLYDALYEIQGFERVNKLLERNVIELAPLAYMRGRTLNNAFIILDEGQNTTSEQMKMFLTRIGFGSKAVITGDITQIDLPKSYPSGLVEAMAVLADLDDISFTRFSAKDVVRHEVVQRVVEAYGRYEESKPAADAD